ncbi:MAG: hypothetical protein ACON4O_07955 [Lentimonas sp.]
MQSRRGENLNREFDEALSEAQGVDGQPTGCRAAGAAQAASNLFTHSIFSKTLGPFEGLFYAIKKR